MSDSSPKPAVRWFWRSCSSRGSSSRVSSRDDDDDNNAATPASAAPSREEINGAAAAALVLEQLDEQWFSDNVVRWPSSRPGSPPGVITKDIIASPFRLLPPSDVLTKPRRRVIGERATTLLHPPRSRRLSDGDYHLRRNLERDAISRRQRLPEPEDPHRRNTDLANSTPKTPTNHDLNNDQSRFCSEANTMEDVFSPLALPPSGPLVGVTEDEELENDLFAKMLANRPAKLTTINPGRLSRGPLQENTSNSNTNSNGGETQKAKPQSRQRRRLKGTKSLTDLEYEELRGLKDLGFEVSKDDLTPHVVRMFPGLQRQGIPPYNSPNSQQQQQLQQREQVGHTVLSQSRFPPVQHLLQWPRRPDSPLTNTPFLDPSIDMKGQLKSWASEMASIVSTEC